MPQIPYLVYGTVTKSNGDNAISAFVSLTADGNTQVKLTDSTGKYLIDLAELGYTSGSSVDYLVEDEFKNQINVGSFIISGQNKSLNYSLASRKNPLLTPHNKDTQIYNIGGKPVSEENPFPVNQEGPIVIADSTGAFVENRISTTSFNSRDAATLLAAATFQGVGEDVSKYGRVGVSVVSDNATDGTLTMEVSRDNVTWGGPTRTWSDTRFASPHMWNIVEKYFRIKYVNGTTQATNLAIQVQYSNNADILLGKQLNETLLDETEAIIVRSVDVAQNPNATYVNSKGSGVDDNNSSSTNLTAATSLVFTGAWSDVGNYSGISVLVEGSSSGTVAGTLQMQFSHDGVTVHRDVSVTELDVTNVNPRTLGVVAKYFRIIYTAVSDLTAFDVQTMFHTQQVELVSRLDQTLLGTEDVRNTRAVLTGIDPDSVYRNVHVTRDGSIANTITSADLGFHAIVSPGGSLKTSQQTHLAGEAFGSVALNTTKWNIDLVGTGTQSATGNGELTMDTGVTANSAVEIDSIDVARFIPANYNNTHHAVEIPDGASYAANNSRKWGAFNATSATCNGIYFELDGGTWYIAHCLAGSATRVAKASWNGAGVAAFPDNAINTNVYEIEYNAGSIIFRVNGNVMHRVNLTATPYANNIHFPVGMSNTNSGGSTTDVSMKLRAGAIYTLGKGTGVDRPKYISGITAGLLVKTGPGHLGKVVIARNGAGGGDATLSIYDALSAVTQIGRIALDTDTTTVIDYDLTFNVGLYVVITGLGTLGTTITFD